MSAATSEQSGSHTLELGAIVADRYRILGLIGTGGMGAVYRAEHVHMKKLFALKLLHPEFLGVEEVRQRFEREAVAAGRIEHPNVVGATDFGKLPDGSFYLVLDYIDGTSLRALLEQEGALPAARAIRIARQTTLALGAAHAAGVVHRDLKPDNVMLIPEPDGSDRVKVLDFGIARVSSPDSHRDTALTRVGVVMGTVAYMSPEQATGQEVDARADLYSLGVMLYEMVAGVVPFDAPLPSQVLARQLVEEPPPLPAGTAPALGELIFDLMQKKADDRPASAQIVLQRLTALTPTPSGRVPAPRRTVPRSALFAAAAAALLLLILLFAISSSSSKPGAASAEPVASSAPPIEPSAAKSAAALTLPAVSPQGSSGASDPTALPDAAGTPSSKAAGKSSLKGAKGKATATATAAPTPAPTQKAAPKPTSKRKTGPGGIYIPPPNEWFK
jgi:eukaryotic-like serine/threonine-protein kinase